MKPKLATNVSVITVCKVSRQSATRSIVLPTSALRNVNVVTRKLDLDQTSVAHTHTERNKCDQTRGHIVMGNVDCTGWLTVGTDSVFYCRYRRTDSLNCLAETLKMINNQAHKLCAWLALKTRISHSRGEYTRDGQSINWWTPSI